MESLLLVCRVLVYFQVENESLWLCKQTQILIMVGEKLWHHHVLRTWNLSEIVIIHRHFIPFCDTHLDGLRKMPTAAKRECQISLIDLILLFVIGSLLKQWNRVNSLKRLVYYFA